MLLTPKALTWLSLLYYNLNFVLCILAHKHLETLSLVAVVVVFESSEYRFLNLDSVSDICGRWWSPLKDCCQTFKVSLSPDSWEGYFEADLNSYFMAGLFPSSALPPPQSLVQVSSFVLDLRNLFPWEVFPLFKSLRRGCGLFILRQRDRFS